MRMSVRARNAWMHAPGYGTRHRRTKNSANTDRPSTKTAALSGSQWKPPALALPVVTHSVDLSTLKRVTSNSPLVGSEISRCSTEVYVKATERPATFGT